MAGNATSSRQSLTQALGSVAKAQAAVQALSNNFDGWMHEEVAKLDAAREKMSLALATRTDLTAADSRASQQERRAEEARLDALPAAQVQSLADNCDSLLGQ